MVDTTKPYNNLVGDYSRPTTTTSSLNQQIRRFNDRQSGAKQYNRFAPKVQNYAPPAPAPYAVPVSPPTAVPQSYKGVQQRSAVNGLGLGSYNTRPATYDRTFLDRAGDIGNVMVGSALLPAATAGDYVMQGLTYAAGGDPNTIKGGKNLAADELKTGIYNSLDNLGQDFRYSQNRTLKMLGADPVADPAAVDMKMVEEARRRRAAGATAAAAAPAAPAAAAAAAKPAVTAAPAAGGVSNQGDNRKGNYWIDGNGVRRDITWDANGNITSGLRDGNDPNVRKSRQANGAAILDNTQQLYTGLNRK